MMVDVFFRMLFNINNCEIIIFVFYFIWVGSNISFVYLVKSINWIRGYVVEFIVYKCCRWIFFNVFIVIFVELFEIVFDWICFIVSIIEDIFFFRWIFFNVFIIIYEVINWIFGYVNIFFDFIEIRNYYIMKFKVKIVLVVGDISVIVFKFCFFGIFICILGVVENFIIIWVFFVVKEMRRIFV